MKKFLFIIIGLLLFVIGMVGCTASKSVTKEYVVDQITDTITKTDTITVLIQLPPDTVMVEAPKIEGTDKQAEDIKSGNLTIAPWFAHSSRSYAVAGIKNNIPYLNLYDLPYNDLVSKPITTTSFNNTKTITKTEVKEVIKYKPWFQDIWFYVSIILSLVLTILIIIKIKK